MPDHYEIDFLPVGTTKSDDAICLRYEINGQTYVHVVDGGYEENEQSLDRYTTQRYHKAAALLADISLRSPTEEENNPADADERYRAVTSALLSKTRDTSKYPLLFKENISYGFWRNLRGVKPISCLLAVALVALGLWLDRAFLVNLQPPEGNELAIAIAGIIILLVWATTVTDASVRRSAQSYAQRLLEALDGK